jgi:hypothetical protein
MYLQPVAEVNRTRSVSQYNGAIANNASNLNITRTRTITTMITRSM